MRWTCLVNTACRCGEMQGVNGFRAPGWPWSRESGQKAEVGGLLWQRRPWLLCNAARGLPVLLMHVRATAGRGCVR